VSWSTDVFAPTPESAQSVVQRPDSVQSAQSVAQRPDSVQSAQSVVQRPDSWDPMRTLRTLGTVLLYALMLLAVVALWNTDAPRFIYVAF